MLYHLVFKMPVSVLMIAKVGFSNYFHDKIRNKKLPQRDSFFPEIIDIT